MLPLQTSTATTTSMVTTTLELLAPVAHLCSLHLHLLVADEVLAAILQGGISRKENMQAKPRCSKGRKKWGVTNKNTVQQG